MILKMLCITSLVDTHGRGTIPPGLNVREFRPILVCPKVWILPLRFDLRYGYFILNVL